MLVTSGEMLQDALINRYAIPSPDFVDSNSAKAFVRTAQELGCPLILSFAEVHLQQMSVKEAANMGKFYANQVQVPVALHLDHGVHMDVIKEAIAEGFTSVMIDASACDLAENIRLTRDVTEYAHAHQVFVEAELGHVGSEDETGPHALSGNIYTEVEAAVLFVRETAVDSLAVSIGTSHGKYKGTPKLNFERLQELHSALAIPLVLHGGSGTGDENLEKCALNGITKVNLYTDFITAALHKVYAEHPDNWLKLLGAGDTAMQDVLRHYYKVLRCAH
jgi:fructose-bisphosphate aldolase class II/tagatose 1,6-diphosphate aldolase GatY/KbaY